MCGRVSRVEARGRPQEVHVCMYTYVVAVGRYAAVQLEGVYFTFMKRDMGRPETLQ